MDLPNNLIECLPAEAQKYCNFVLFQTINLPIGFTVAKQQLRKEGQNTQASYRIVLENPQTNQIVIIKQFLYDWAPPAYDYPCLWYNTKQFSPALKTAPRYARVGQRLLWIGKNYRGQQAATIDLERTRIEVTFNNIPLRDEILIDLIQGLLPCDDKIRAQLLNTSFAQMSYPFRVQNKVSDVPLSYWKHKRSKDCVSRALIEERSPSWRCAWLERNLRQHGYHLNSLFEFIRDKTIVEKEYLFEHETYPGVFVHLLATPQDSLDPIAFPPSIGDQVCQQEKIVIGEKAMHLSYLDPHYGNYEFVWQEEGMIYLLLIRAAAWVTYAWAFQLMGFSIE